MIDEFCTHDRGVDPHARRSDREREMAAPPHRNVGDTVLAVVERDRLAAILAGIHRAGLGHVARVLDPKRGDLTGQLRRVGLPELPEATNADPASVIVAVTSAGRAGLAANLMANGGAKRVYVTSKGVAITPDLLQPLDSDSDAAP